jgi:hypothetical protein
MELFNVVLGRKKDPVKCRGKLTIKSHRDVPVRVSSLLLPQTPMCR